MIFNIRGHIEMIREGLYSPIPGTIIKTETRRLNRGIYQVGKDYAVQRKRGVKAEPDIRIVMDKIWEERALGFFAVKLTKYPVEMCISTEDAWLEGGYTPEQYEKVFRELNPKWDGWSRWAYKFHVIEVQT